MSKPPSKHTRRRRKESEKSAPRKVSRRSGDESPLTSWPRTDLRHWQQRLLLRKPPVGSDALPGELSTRIKHGTSSAYFPLGSADPATAAARALEIYQTVVDLGWSNTCHLFPRELSLAVHWANNPLGWTYTTLHSRMLNAPAPPAAINVKPATRWRIALIEKEGGLRRALGDAIAQHAECGSDAVFGSVESAMRDLPNRAPHLLLINQQLVNPPVVGALDRLRSLAPQRPVLLYSVYEDSEQLFRSTPGGASGYLLKRTCPDQLLAPLASIPAGPTLSSDQIARSVRRYFQKLIESWPAEESAPELAKLTLREQQVLNLMAKGHVDKEIAETLGISVWTVHGHVKNIFDKFGVHSRTEAVVKFLHK